MFECPDIFTEGGPGKVTGSTIGSVILGSLGSNYGFYLGGAIALSLLGGGPIIAADALIAWGLGGGIGATLLGLAGSYLGGELGGKAGEIFDDVCDGALNCKEKIPKDPEENIDPEKKLPNNNFEKIARKIQRLIFQEKNH